MQMSREATHTGTLRRNPDGTLSGELRDALGYTIVLTGTRDPAGGYVLTGAVGDVPGECKGALLP